jgi:hypothetical protein
VCIHEIAEHAFPPSITVPDVPNDVPVSVTVVPPLVGPLLGTTEVITGAAYVYET